MSTPKSVARIYLEWFGQEAEEFALEGTVQYATGTDYVDRYVHRTFGVVENALPFVQKIAEARLTPDGARAVVEAAMGLLRII